MTTFLLCVFDHMHNMDSLAAIRVVFEPPRGKTNNVVSEQVRHKPTCTVPEKS